MTSYFELSIDSLKQRVVAADGENQDEISAIITEISACNLNSVDSSPGDVASILKDIVQLSGRSNSSHLLQSLSLMIARSPANPSELTCIHGALAAHIRKHDLVNCEQVREIKLFPELSEQYLPLNSASEIAQYFDDAWYIRSRRNEWNEAAISAAISLTLHSNVHQYRVWGLSELIARGSMRNLPRAVKGSAECSVVTEFGKLFESKSISALPKLCSFYDANIDKFQRWGLDKLLRRAVLAYCIQCIRRLASRAPIVAFDTLFQPFLDCGVTLEELRSAGLDLVCRVQSDEVVLLLPPPTQNISNQEDAVKMLYSTAELSSLLQRLVYKCEI